MTPSEACALLEKRRDLWPEWVHGVEWILGVVDIFTDIGIVPVRISGHRWTSSKPAKVRPGLPDEENVRRILAAAEKGYRQRQCQIEKQRQRKPIERKSKLKPNRKRKAKAFEENFGGKDRVLWGKARPCDTCGAPPPSQNSHVLTRGSRLGKAREMISQCDDCHRLLGQQGATLYELRLAEKVYQEWLDQGGRELPSGLELHGETR